MQSRFIFSFSHCACTDRSIFIDMGKRLPVYQSAVTLFFLFVSFGGNYWQQGAALIGYVLWQTILVWGYFVYRQRKNQTGWFCRRYFSDNSTVFNESDSFLNMEKHRYLVFRNLLFNL